MSELNIVSKVQELLEMQAMLDEVKSQVDGLKAELREELERREVSEMTCGGYVIRNTEVTSQRFDSKAFIRDFNRESYQMYCRTVISHRFSIG